MLLVVVRGLRTLVWRTLIGTLLVARIAVGTALISARSRILILLVVN